MEKCDIFQYGKNNANKGCNTHKIEWYRKDHPKGCPVAAAHAEHVSVLNLEPRTEEEKRTFAYVDFIFQVQHILHTHIVNFARKELADRLGVDVKKINALFQDTDTFDLKLISELASVMGITAFDIFKENPEPDDDNDE